MERKLKPRVIFLTDSIEGGGAENIVVAQARALSPQKFDKILLITRSCDTSAWQTIKENGLEVVHLNRKRRYDLYAGANLYRAFQRADIIHAHKEGSILHAIIWAGIKRRAKIVAQLHTKTSQYGSFYSYVTPWCCKRADWTVMVSKLDYEEHIEAWRLNPSQTSVIYNGLDPDQYGLTSRSDARRLLEMNGRIKVIGSVGRIAREKGYEYLLQAFALLRKTFDKEVHLIISGKHSKSEEDYFRGLHFQARELGISENVKFLGFRKDVASLLPAFDVFVMPSVCECLPVALLEAMATGLPVVATRVGGIPEVVETGKSGLLVPPRNSTALQEALDKVLANPEFAQKLGNAAIEQVQLKFSQESMVKSLEQLYEKILIS